MAPRTTPNHPRSVTSVRLDDAEKAEMNVFARRLGLTSLGDYFRRLHEKEVASTIVTPRFRADPMRVSLFHKTKYGKMLCGNSLDWMFGSAKPKSVDLIMTSPPFGLVRKKSYGNEDADEYCNWFRPFAAGFKRILKDNGSLVIDIGSAWKPGLPTKSLYHFELLLMLCREFGFHLCQEHYWWNPSKLPTPAEWVNVRRIRVKDAINCIWWLSPTAYPKASNRRVLSPYSDSMRKLLKDGYTAKLRPSGHDISSKFQRDNVGSVPPNLLAVANTESSGAYQDFCRVNNLDIHPARFPVQIPDYFVRFLTNPGDVVFDPFGGSCVTGLAAEHLRRRWVCVEMNSTYLQGAKSRFPEKGEVNGRPKTSKYCIYTPAAGIANNADEHLLDENGGATRS